ncbi:hypothetical protein EN925_15050 [Mesorhizobium sp. M7A.F.Ca.US.006.04.2.1]|uniref:hypothetical protein n=1 Tax=unclassified Mesorhizobium TaxID=325217 RepID=UPI000FCC3F50|nr:MULTISPECIES: hypothetical protein [unclassified Mesorhizobium]RUX73898.1 hypothetical protein EN990_19680 [Mesorhizobium sp. M7A.F.Ca.US.005.03.1.1]RUY18462.1 hypothetical protein EN991_04100 [Mesorhizobium sp. M7A.F.Ca.US.005.03.2.1]RVA90404.1 hypothetical protein EN925_15050 [Mesorhizobium sp. M7A.F.Ca.US.006.04.2.1]
MAETELDSLLERMPEIAKAVNSFTSEVVQQTAFEALIAAFTGNDPKPRNESQGAPEAATSNAGGEKTKKSNRSPRKSRSNDKSKNENAFDELALVNAIREDARFEQFRSKVILGSASKTQQVKFISWYAGETPLTSGNMLRALDILGVKIDAPAASRAVTAAKNDYIATPNTKPVTFRLTTRAHIDYEKWLLNDTAAS